ncbi:MAG TPA: 50S ribosomal protein L11 methyltransferase [Candidatus Limnocylindrales bacterium]|nr:50S ribosomal protein L11 methyltransferase [Candidatus Limnocylindrales bacterium]
MVRTPRGGRGRRDVSPGHGDAPAALPRSHRRAFVARHTRLREVDGLPGLRLHLADDVETLWPATEAALGIDGAPIPFWAFAWAGGLALARYVLEHPDSVKGARVLDFATGSGLVAIAAARAGAATITATDIDPFAEVAVALNARANGVHVGYIGRDLLDGPPPAVDVLLAADTWYEGPLAERLLPWLQAAAASGIRVLVGDPGRRYLPTGSAAGMTELARYRVHTTTVLEDRAEVEGSVLDLAPQPPGR